MASTTPTTLCFARTIRDKNEKRAIRLVSKLGLIKLPRKTAADLAPYTFVVDLEHVSKKEEHPLRHSQLERSDHQSKWKKARRLENKKWKREITNNRGDRKLPSKYVQPEVVGDGIGVKDRIQIAKGVGSINLQDKASEFRVPNIGNKANWRKEGFCSDEGMLRSSTWSPAQSPDPVRGSEPSLNPCCSTGRKVSCDWCARPGETEMKPHRRHAVLLWATGLG
ncbi:hypothetical protein MMC34_002055 [Xylographa carneopallida]|nr:hypothetical protein [Xylographa carneopallida]